MKKPRKQKQKTPQQKRRSAGRRQRILHFAGRAAFLVILLAAAVLALTVFFKVDTIEVEGSSRYTSAEIADSMDVKVGDNLFLWDKVGEADKLTEKFPYLDTVQIRRRLPDKLCVTVTECRAALAVPSDGGYYRVSAGGKVLEVTPDDGGLPVATGVSLLGAVPGHAVDRASDAYADALLTVLTALDAGGMLENVDFINLQSLTDIRIGYEGRFDLRVGALEKLPYRLRFAQTVAAERLSPSDIGRLYWDAKDRLHFVPDTAENVARSKTMLDAAPPDEANGKTPPDGGAGQPAGADETVPSDGDEADGDGGDPEDAPEEDPEDTPEDG